MGSHVCIYVVGVFFIFIFNFSVMYISFITTYAFDQFERTLKVDAKLIIDGAKT